MTPCRLSPDDDFGPKGGSFRKARFGGIAAGARIVNCSIRRCRRIADALRREADILFSHRRD